MSFKRLSDTEFISKKLEFMTKTEVIASVLLFFEYRINYNAKFKRDRPNRYRLAANFLFTHLESNERFLDLYTDMSDMLGKVVSVCKSNNWKSIECVIDQMDLRMGNSGSFDLVQRSTAINTFRKVFEKHYRIPVSRILVMVKEERSDVK